MKHANYINLAIAVVAAVVVVYAFSQTYWSSGPQTLRLELPAVTDLPEPDQPLEPRPQEPATSRVPSRPVNSNLLRNRSLLPEDLAVQEAEVSAEESTADLQPGDDALEDADVVNEGDASIPIGTPSSGVPPAVRRPRPIQVGTPSGARQSPGRPGAFVIQPRTGSSSTAPQQQPEGPEPDQPPVVSEGEPPPPETAPPPARRQSPPPPPTRSSMP